MTTLALLMPALITPLAELSIPWWILTLLVICGGLVVWAAVGIRLSFATARKHPTTEGANLGGSSAFDRELDRARRHNRPLAIVRVPTPTSMGSLTGEAATAKGKTALAQDVLAFSRVLRSYDVVWAQPGNVFLLLPELDKDQAYASLERVRRTAHYLVPKQGVQIVAFPEDGITAGALQLAIGMNVAGTDGQADSLTRPSLRIILEAELGEPPNAPRREGR